MRRIRVTATLLFVAFTAAALGGPPSFELGDSSIDCGSATVVMGNGSLMLTGTIGQADTGYMAGGLPTEAFLLAGGVWGFGYEREPCPWDCDPQPDGFVGTDDFLALIGQWGQVDVSCDFDGDGVATSDFLDLIGRWGACP